MFRNLTKKPVTNIPEYSIWRGMIDRCMNPNSTAYKHYGGRGITICKEWLTSFETFYKDMGNRTTSKHSLDRVNNEEGYNKNNCRWVTSKEQIRNRRNTVIVTYEKLTKPLATWCEELDLDYSRTLKRIKRGYSIRKAFELPIQ